MPTQKSAQSWVNQGGGTSGVLIDQMERFCHYDNLTRIPKTPTEDDLAATKIPTKAASLNSLINAAIHGRDNANPDWVVDNSAGYASGVCTTASTGGGAYIDNSAGDLDQCIIRPNDTSGETVWENKDIGTDHEPMFATQVKVNATALPTITAGFALVFTDPLDNTTDANQIKFWVSPDDSQTTWQCVYSVGGTDYIIDTGITAAVSTEYALRIEVDKDRYGHFYIDNDKVHTTSVALTTGIDMIPHVGVENPTAAAGYDLTVRFIAVACNWTDA